MLKGNEDMIQWHYHTKEHEDPLSTKERADDPAKDDAKISEVYDAKTGYGLLNSDSLRAHVDISSKGADQFVELYYKLFDTQRGVLNRLYRDSSAILWNGNAYSGITPFSEFYNKLSSSEHIINSYDCHPLPTQSLDPNTPGSIIVNVSGTVKYSNETNPRLFSQSFVLSPDPTNGSFYVWSDCFRFV
ncbi:NTF2- export protein 2 [Lunasporangiospora selenospora]|uniref:NTF2- export protein 2 n=1 Tax=Lunasporangiospora selenospora TaxID=979761 RepID=A0A9P6FTC6_9FUNG|nr:NTF2- export protein 2 [Lunasporangiospora selenospora]